MTACLVSERIPPTSNGVYTDTSIHLEDAHWEKLCMGTDTYAGGASYKICTISCRNMSRSAVHIESRPTCPQTDFDNYDGYDDFSDHKSCGQ